METACSKGQHVPKLAAGGLGLDFLEVKCKL